MSPPAFDVASNKELITRRQFSHVAPCSLFVTAHTKPKGLVKSSGTTSCAAVVTPLVQLCPNPIGHPHTTPCHQHTRLLHTAAVMPLVQLCPIAIGHQYTRLYHQHTRLLHTAAVTPLVQFCPNPIGHPHTTPCHQHTRLYTLLLAQLSQSLEKKASH